MASTVVAPRPAARPTDAARPWASGRLPGLDRLRAAALLLMIVHHVVEWLAGDARRVPPRWRWFAVTDTAAPAFAVACGASLQLFVAGRRRRHAIGRVAREVARRYGLLVPIGMALGAVV